MVVFFVSSFSQLLSPSTPVSGAILRHVFDEIRQQAGSIFKRHLLYDAGTGALFFFLIFLFVCSALLPQLLSAAEVLQLVLLYCSLKGSLLDV